MNEIVVEICDMSQISNIVGPFHEVDGTFISMDKNQW